MRLTLNLWNEAQLGDDAERGSVNMGGYGYSTCPVDEIYYLFHRKRGCSNQKPFIKVQNLFFFIDDNLFSKGGFIILARKVLMSNLLRRPETIVPLVTMPTRLFFLSITGNLPKLYLLNLLIA
jgi:hypothetical protein